MPDFTYEGEVSHWDEFTTISTALLWQINEIQYICRMLLA